VPDLLEGVGGAYAIPPVSWKTRLTVRAQKIQNPAPDGVLNARRRKKGARKPLLDELNPMLPRRAIYCRFESGLFSRMSTGRTRRQSARWSVGQLVISRTSTRCR
jgi:hypothetical protein